MNINTREYWDEVYHREGGYLYTPRQYPLMFNAVIAVVPPNSTVVELGCGCGILGKRLVEEKNVNWYGYDISEVAIDECHKQGLPGRMCSIVHEIDGLISPNDVVIGTEFLEHLDEIDALHILREVHESLPNMIIWTTPNRCMGPEEVPEHTAEFSMHHMVQLHQKALGSNLLNYSVYAENVDPVHLMWVMKRKAAMPCDSGV